MLCINVNVLTFRVEFVVTMSPRQYVGEGLNGVQDGPGYEDVVVYRYNYGNQHHAPTYTWDSRDGYRLDLHTCFFNKFLLQRKKNHCDVSSS